jgi:TRAP-type C4-dicarboxylate transport system permease small subunit
VRIVLWCLENVAEIGASVFMVLMFLSTFANVIGRYVFNSPIQWAEELSRYAFIWLVFLGSAACTKRKRHIVIDSLVQALPVRLRLPLIVLADLATLALAALLVVYGGKLTLHATQTTATLLIPKSIVYAVIPATGCFLLVYALADLRRDIGLLARGGVAA